MARRKPKSKSKLHYALLLGLIPACSGGGCSSCGGVTPLPGGFSNDARIENAASVRITQSGFDFLESNIGSIAGNVVGGGEPVISFPVNESMGTATILDLPTNCCDITVNYTICPGGPMTNPLTCTVEIDLGGSDLAINSAAPHDINIVGYIPIRLQDLQLETSIASPHLTLSGNGACPPSAQTFANVGVTAVISVETDLDQAHARYGYSRIRIKQLTASKTDIENAFKACGGFDADVVNFFKGFIIDFAYDSLVGTLGTTLEDQLCQKATPGVTPTCPNGTNDVDGICRYGSDASAECVSSVLGLDGHANLSGLLASLSPGTKGGMDFLFAGGGDSVRTDGSGQTWGDLNPVGNGATISFFGGVEPNPVSKCVPLANVPRPSGLEVPDELVNDALITNWPNMPGPDLGIGVSESFFNYALAGMYNSGLLCIGLSTETVDLLNSSTLGLLAQSLRDLGLQREPQPIAIMLKPGKPPHVTFGSGTSESDPTMLLELPEATFDFYINSSDRYVRFMSATFDITAPITLTVTPEGLVPTLTKLDIANGKIENSSLLREDPATLAASLQGLLSSQVGALIGSGLPPIDLNGSLASLGLRLVIPETVEGQGSPGIRTVTKNGERYLGIFGDLETATMMMSLETDATIDVVHIDPDGLSADTLTPTNAPFVQVHVSTLQERGLPIEHQVRVDGGMWRPWTRRDVIQVQDESFRLQGKHKIEVRSRTQGDAYSVDPTPTELDVVIDAVAPEVKVTNIDDDGVATLDVFDLVSQDASAVRYKIDDEAFGPWIPVGELKTVTLPEDASELTVEAKDESGNVGTAQQAIIRGLPHGGSGGCGCAVPGATEGETGNPYGWLGIAALGAAVALRRKRAAKKASSGALLGRALFGKPGRQAAAAATILVIGGTWSGCSCDDDTNPTDKYSCVDPCITLEPGLIGEYTSVATNDAGDIWVAGYLEANWDQVYQFGDLVVGKWNGTAVDWEIVDGVPTEPEVDGKVFNLKGFRGGQTSPGDDVGLWTSVALDPSSGQPAVAYYDRTNKALKFARFNGTAWEVSFVDNGSDNDVGRYAKLVYDGNTAKIAFLAIDSAADGFLTSRVRLATATSNGFTIEDVAVNDATPCRAALCTGGTKCVDTGECSAASSACGTCAMGEECVSVGGTPTCTVPLGVGKLDAQPMGAGLYVSVAKVPGGGLGIAFYDRVDGSLKVAAKESDGWKTVTVDGGPQPDGTYLDAGIGTSLFIDDAGDWHLSYVNGYDETLKYAKVVNGAVDSVETVDDGLTLGGVAFPDGLHVVGDDSSIRVNAQGDVTISYQDATGGKLRYAVGTETSGGHDWTVKVVDTDNFGGFFSAQVDAGGKHQLVHWWRKLGPDAEGTLKMTGDVTVLASP